MPEVETAGPDVFFADTEYFVQWSLAVETQSDHKRGAPPVFPQAFLEWLACVRVRTSLDYRSLAEFAHRALNQVRDRVGGQARSMPWIEAARAPHFTHLRRKLSEMSLNLELVKALAQAPPRYVLLTIDGVRVTDARGWTELLARRVSRGWVRVEARPAPPGPFASPRQG